MAAHRGVDPGEPRQLAGGRGRALLLHLDRSRSGWATAEEPSEGRCRPSPWQTARARNTTLSPAQRLRRSRPCSPTACQARRSGTEQGRSSPAGRPCWSPPSAPRRTTHGSWPTLPGLITPAPRPPGIRVGTSLPPHRCEGRCRSPTSQRWRLLATFNGGFIYNDGGNGSSIGGTQYEPLKQGLATLIGYTNGRVDVQTWRGGTVAGTADRLCSPEPAADHRPRTAEPVLNDSSQWGYTLGNAVRVWRTGAGIDRHGNLIYAAADYQTVTTLAQDPAARRRRAGDAARHQPRVADADHLRAHGRLDPVRVVPNYQQAPTRYLVPDDRDFFAVYRRVPGPVTVPFK